MIETEDIQIDSPIDALRLIHKAMLSHAARVEKEAQEIEIGGSLQSFRSAFNDWASALLYLSDVEELFILAPLAENESDGFENKVKGMMATGAEDEHVELIEMLQSVLVVLDEEIRRTSVIERTKQHVYGRVMALRIAQQDHVEDEAAFVLPLARDRMNEVDQLAAARHLLIDEAAEDPRWVLDWVARELSPNERELLAALEARFQAEPP